MNTNCCMLAVPKVHISSSSTKMVELIIFGMRGLDDTLGYRIKEPS